MQSENNSDGIYENDNKVSHTKPLITIITVVYNGVQQIEPTIRSVLDQTYGNVEYIIIDGGSKDGTIDIVKKYEDKITYFTSEPDKGIYDAMNKGIGKSNGEFINFMNCGDRFASTDVLSNLFDEKKYDADILYGDAIVEYPNFQSLWKRIPIEEMWKRTPFCHQACFVRTSLLKAIEFDLKYKLSSDFDFLYKSYLSGNRFLYIDQIVCLYDYADGATIKAENLSLQERRRAVFSHGITLEKWLYYMRITLYIRLATSFKKVIGKRITGWLTILLKN